MKINLQKILKISALFLLTNLCACATASKVMNPFYEEPSELAVLGSPNDSALNSTKNKDENARKALEQLSTYQSSKMPQPYNPVLQPAVVRLMWIADHLNKNGDLVPAHYYYVKVLSDRWALSDAFEIESQLGKTTDSSSVPFTYAPTK